MLVTWWQISWNFYTLKLCSDALKISVASVIDFSGSKNCCKSTDSWLSLTMSEFWNKYDSLTYSKDLSWCSIFSHNKILSLSNYFRYSFMYWQFLLNFFSTSSYSSFEKHTYQISLPVTYFTFAYFSFYKNSSCTYPIQLIFVLLSLFWMLSLNYESLSIKVSMN